MSADLRETPQTCQGTQTNIKTNGVFAKRCVFAQEREVGNEARSQAGLDVLLVADSTIEEEHNSQAARLKKRLESKLRIQWTLVFLPAMHSFPFLVIASHFSW